MFATQKAVCDVLNAPVDFHEGISDKEKKAAAFVK